MNSLERISWNSFQQCYLICLSFHREFLFRFGAMPEKLMFHSGALIAFSGDTFCFVDNIQSYFAEKIGLKA